MSFSQISTSVSIISSGLKGYQAISLTQFVTSAQSLIASGSAIEIANAFFLANGNITPNASSWTAVTTANTAYISLLPAGSAGVQTLSAWYSDTAPTWVTSKAGWYASAGSLTRYVGGVTKTSPTQYDDAFILPAFQERSYDKITIVDTATIDTLDVTGYINSHRGIIVENQWYFDDDPTENELYDALTAYIVGVGDKIIVSGALGVTSAQTMTISFAQRVDADSITLYGVFTDNGTQGSKKCDDGDGTVFQSISMAW